MNAAFHPVAEGSVDSRKRISLGKAHVSEDMRYLISTNDDGEILLTPVASVPIREMIAWENPAQRESLVRAMQQAATGDIHDLGDFAQFADDD